ncbi:hypothetical protein [Nicoliella lavandulae]|uniref:Uncharacterized protein n=1 Tax=Nicoliella lavandulae TaxID=3082954 RepID=A0ABU8SMB6_9LACO
MPSKRLTADQLRTVKLYAHDNVASLELHDKLYVCKYDAAHMMKNATVFRKLIERRIRGKGGLAFTVTLADARESNRKDLIELIQAHRAPRLSFVSINAVVTIASFSRDELQPYFNKHLKQIIGSYLIPKPKQRVNVDYTKLRLEEEIAKLKCNIEKHEAAEHEAAQEIGKLKRELNSMTNQVQAKNAENDGLRLKNTVLQNRCNALNDKLHDEQANWIREHDEKVLAENSRLLPPRKKPGLLQQFFGDHHG